MEDELIIGIENKILSAESNSQTEDYSKSIYDEFSNCEYVLLYLTLNGDTAVNSDFSAMTYNYLVRKLKQVDFDYRDDIRYKVIFDELILHVETNYE